MGFTPHVRHRLEVKFDTEGGMHRYLVVMDDLKFEDSREQVLGDNQSLRVGASEFAARQVGSATLPPNVSATAPMST